MNILLAVCTRDRPLMLAELLQSCITLRLVEGVKLRFLVVENGPLTPSAATVARFAADLPLSYLHAPEIGIVRARNAAVETFLAGDADWLGFVDDDEVIAPGWLHAMVAAIRAHPGYCAYSGHSRMIEPENAPAIFKAAAERVRKPRAKLEARMVTTQNVLFARRVFAPDGLNMRFDMRLNTAGGSDFLLTHLLTDRGERIRVVPEALSTEYVLPERAALGFRTRKMIAQAHHRGLISLIRFGRLKGHVANLLIALHSAARLCILAPIGAAVLVVDEQRGLRIFAECLLLLCSALGRPRILWRRPVDIYATVQGR